MNICNYLIVNDKRLFELEMKRKYPGKNTFSAVHGSWADYGPTPFPPYIAVRPLDLMYSRTFWAGV